MPHVERVCVCVHVIIVATLPMSGIFDNAGMDESRKQIEAAEDQISRHTSQAAAPKRWAWANRGVRSRRGICFIY